MKKDGERSPRPGCQQTCVSAGLGTAARGAGPAAALLVTGRQRRGRRLGAGTGFRRLTVAVAHAASAARFFGGEFVGSAFLVRRLSYSLSGEPPS